MFLPISNNWWKLICCFTHRNSGGNRLSHHHACQPWSGNLVLLQFRTPRVRVGTNNRGVRMCNSAGNSALTLEFEPEIPQQPTWWKFHIFYTTGNSNSSSTLPVWIFSRIANKETEEQEHKNKRKQKQKDQNREETSRLAVLRR